jgi:hypothetical protein
MALGMQCRIVRAWTKKNDHCLDWLLRCVLRCVYVSMPLFRFTAVLFAGVPFCGATKKIAKAAWKTASFASRAIPYHEELVRIHEPSRKKLVRAVNCVGVTGESRELWMVVGIYACHHGARSRMRTVTGGVIGDEGGGALWRHRGKRFFDEFLARGGEGRGWRRRCAEFMSSSGGDADNYYCPARISLIDDRSIEMWSDVKKKWRHKRKPWFWMTPVFIGTSTNK